MLDSKHEVLSHVACGYAKAGQLDTAIQVANKIENHRDKAMILTRVAYMHGKSGHEIDDNARTILHDIIREFHEPTEFLIEMDCTNE